jgi:hypothetical protein
MLKALRLPALVFGAALALMSPATALAERHHESEYHERHEWREARRHWYRHYYVRPVYPYGRHYYYAPYGYYDRWGYWHPY